MLIWGGGDLLLPAFLLWSLPGPLPCDTLGLEGGEASVLVTGTAPGLVCTALYGVLTHQSGEVMSPPLLTVVRVLF